MSVSGWGVWSERECRPARREGGTPWQEPGGAPAKPRNPLAHHVQGISEVRASGFRVAAALAGSPRSARTARAQAIHTLQTPRSFSESFLAHLDAHEAVGLERRDDLAVTEGLAR